MAAKRNTQVPSQGRAGLRSATTAPPSRAPAPPLARTTR
jgi:hypothetical protein